MATDTINGNLFTAYLIDPYLEQVEPIQVSDSLSELAGFIGTLEIGHFLEQPNGDRLLAAADIFQQEHVLIPPAWKFLYNETTEDLLYGRSLWVNIQMDSHQLKSPQSSLESVQRRIQFQGFIDLDTIDISNSYGASITEFLEENYGFSEYDDDDFEDYLNE